MFRNQVEDSRWNAKPVCLALGGVVRVRRLPVLPRPCCSACFDIDALRARGLQCTPLALPLLLVASRRQAQWVSKLKVSNSAAFYSATLLLVGVYLLFMAAAATTCAIRRQTGAARCNWCRWCLRRLVLLVVMLLSGSLRAWLRVFLGKNFFSYRYDYRRGVAALHRHAVHQVQSAGGGRAGGARPGRHGGESGRQLWFKALGDDRHFLQVASRWNMPPA